MSLISDDSVPLPRPLLATFRDVPRGTARQNSDSGIRCDERSERSIASHDFVRMLWDLHKKNGIR